MSTIPSVYLTSLVISVANGLNFPTYKNNAELYQVFQAAYNYRERRLQEEQWRNQIIDAALAIPVGFESQTNTNITVRNNVGQRKQRSDRPLYSSIKNFDRNGAGLNRDGDRRQGSWKPMAGLEIENDSNSSWNGPDKEDLMWATRYRGAGTEKPPSLKKSSSGLFYSFFDPEMSELNGGFPQPPPRLHHGDKYLPKPLNLGFCNPGFDVIRNADVERFSEFLLPYMLLRTQEKVELVKAVGEAIRDALLAARRDTPTAQAFGVTDSLLAAFLLLALQLLQAVGPVFFG